MAAHQAPPSLGFSRHLEWVDTALSNAWKWKVKVKSLTLCDPMDCSLPVSSVHGVFQARVLEWVLQYSLSPSVLLQGVNKGFPGDSDTNESACNAGNPGFNPWVRKIPWRRKWQPTPVFLPGESHGQRSLAGYSPWGPKRVQHNLATKQQQGIIWYSIF